MLALSNLTRVIQTVFILALGYASCKRWPVCITRARFGRESTRTQTWFLYSKPRFNEQRDETHKDEMLDRLKEHILTGFPERARDIHPSVRPFWNFQDELSKGCQIIMPSTLHHRCPQDTQHIKVLPALTSEPDPVCTGQTSTKTFRQ